MNNLAGRMFQSTSISIFLCLVLVGCAPDFPIPARIVEEIEPNNTFSQATDAHAVIDEPVIVSGTFSSGSDVDVFYLGSFEAGQTLTVNLRSDSVVARENIAVALFDEDENIAILGDQRLSRFSDFEVYHIVRKPGGYYLALSPVQYISAGVFGYRALVVVESGPVPEPQNQVVFLNFDGASNIRIGGKNFRDLNPFADLGYDDTMAREIVDRVREDFSGLDIDIIASYEHGRPGGPHSVVYITGSDGDYYGVAEGVDWYNQNPNDQAIIFAGEIHRPNLTRQQFIHGVANVTSHELGHLLGLEHTLDHGELMDQTTPLSLLVLNQDFYRAPLAKFPIGWQDSMELLIFALGLLPLL